MLFPVTFSLFCHSAEKKKDLLNHHPKSTQCISELRADTDPEHLASRMLTQLSPPAQLLSTCWAHSF